MIDNNRIIVSVQCITYNHEPYIRQCLEGFVIQKTNFPFEAIVHDDASTDGTAAIIREYAEKYPEIIKPILETENQWSKNDGSLGRIMGEASHGKYIALCEGDDYWIDPYKLQKQVDYLESHPECGLVYTSAYVREGDDISGKVIGQDVNAKEAMMIANPIPTVTTMFRSELSKQYVIDIEPGKRNWLMGDKPLWHYLRIHSEVKYLPDITSVYRVLRESASHSADFNKELKFRMSARDINFFFIDKYFKEPKKRQLEINTTLQIYYSAVIPLCLQHGKKKEGFQMYFNGVKYLPWRMKCSMLLYLFFPYAWRLRSADN